MEINLKKSTQPFFTESQTMPALGLIGGAVLGSLISSDIGMYSGFIGFFIMLHIGIEKDKQTAIAKMKQEYKKQVELENNRFERNSIAKLVAKVGFLENQLTEVKDILARRATRKAGFDPNGSVLGNSSYFNDDQERSVAFTTSSIWPFLDSKRPYYEYAVKIDGAHIDEIDQQHANRFLPDWDTNPEGNSEEVKQSIVL